MTDKSFELHLANAAGVPVLRVGGALSKHALNAVRFTMDRLATAGHYHIVLNIEKAQSSSLDFLAGLSDAVANIKKHYGAVDLVATQERIQQILGIDRVAKLFRLSNSESQAIRRIKRLAQSPDTIDHTSARLMEKQ
jgi:anti-sigma B factor antagonist